MDRQEIMRKLARWFDIEPDEDGTFDIDSREWQTGCYNNGVWLCLAEIVYCIENRF